MAGNSSRMAFRRVLLPAPFAPQIAAVHPRALSEAFSSTRRQPSCPETSFGSSIPPPPRAALDEHRQKHRRTNQP